MAKKKNPSKQSSGKTAASGRRGRKKTDSRRKKKSKTPKSRSAGREDSSDAPSGFPIVGIGASAGGLEALKSFFDAMPDEPGWPVL